MKTYLRACALICSLGLAGCAAGPAEFFMIAAPPKVSEAAQINAPSPEPAPAAVRRTGARAAGPAQEKAAQQEAPNLGGLDAANARALRQQEENQRRWDRAARTALDSVCKNC